MRLLLIGGGGHCRSVLDSLLPMNEYDEIGFIDKTDFDNCLGIPLVGSDDDLFRLFDEGWSDAFISVGSIGNTALRRKLYEKVKKIGFRIPSIIDSTATVAHGTIVEEGVFIGKHAVVNAGAKIGKCAIINTSCIIEHDCEIGNFSHVSPGAILCGRVSIGSDSHIGAGSVVRQGINIGNNVLIGLGSVVVKNIQSFVTAYGNPCKVVNS